MFTKISWRKLDFREVWLDSFLLWGKGGVVKRRWVLDPEWAAKTLVHMKPSASWESDTVIWRMTRMKLLEYTRQTQPSAWEGSLHGVLNRLGRA